MPVIPAFQSSKKAWPGPLPLPARDSPDARLDANMMEINLAYYYLQDSVVTIILFGCFGTVTLLTALLLWVMRDE